MNANKKKFNIINYFYDIPGEVLKKKITKISIDTEAMGLKIPRDRLCVVQIRIEKNIYIVHFPERKYNQSPNLKKLLLDHSIEKYMHYAFFDMEMVGKYLGVLMHNIKCTRTLSKITRTYSDKHGLKYLCKNFLSVELNKESQCSYWGAEKLTEAQKKYAAQDVYYLEDIYEKLLHMSERERRIGVFNSMMRVLPHAVYISLNNYDIINLINHH